jgi:hypothetical protein
MRIRIVAASAAVGIFLTAAPATAAPPSGPATATESYESTTTPLSIDRSPARVSRGAQAESRSHAAPAYSPCAYDFRDAPKGHTFYDSITWMACAGITTGYGNGIFGVKKPITRAETASFLYRLSGESRQEPTGRPFKDVAADSTHATAIAWMKDKGLATGFKDRSFGAGQSITRGDIARFMARYADDDTFTAPAVSPFNDMGPSAGSYRDATWLASTGLVSGYADKTFRPAQPVTRGETSKFFYALESHLNGTPTPPAVAPKPYPHPAAPKPPASTSAVWTTVSTGLYQQPNYSSKKLVGLKAQAKLTKLGTSGSMTKVKSGNTTGYVNSDFLTAGQPGTTAKPFPRPVGYSQHAANNVARWCWGVNISTMPGWGGVASYEITGYGGDDMDVDEAIVLGSAEPVNTDRSKAVQYHECAHILQFRAYKYDGAALDRAMDRVYPNGKYEGTEHMADCMADAMGAKRTGTYTEGQWTYTYVVGYGGKCTTAQLSAAKKIIAGQRV